MSDRRAPANKIAEPAWTGSLLPVIGAIALTLLVGNAALLIILPQVMRESVSAGLSALDAEARGRVIALGIVSVSCSLGAVACLLLDMARRHVRTHATELQAARTRDDVDLLTGALHRSRFRQRLTADLMAAPAVGFVTLHLIDIEAFSAINARWGQEGGDAVLRATVERLSGAAPAGHLIGRLGADEFALAVFSALPPQPDGDATTLAAVLSRPVGYRDEAIPIRISIGTRIAQASGTDADSLIEAADVALREAKRCSGKRTLVYSDALAAAVQARRALEARLVAAAASPGGFDVHYQPICHAADGRLWGYEALVRLPARDGAPAVPPDVFIPVAERLGLIPLIGRRVLREAIAEAARWPGGPVVSINLSALQFATDADSAENLLIVTREALATHNLAPERLVYEITEGRHLESAPEVLADLRALKDMGVGLALDDFGTGYSTLAYLWAFPFDKLKIDASFVRAMNSGDNQAKTVLATVIRLGHALGLTVTAEGVETEHQAQYLRLLGCDLLQGYLYGRPTDADATQAGLAQLASGDAARPASVTQKPAASAAHAAAGKPDRGDRAIVA